MRSCRAHRTEIEPEERQHPKLKLTNPLCPIICPWSIDIGPPGIPGHVGVHELNKTIALGKEDGISRRDGNIEATRWEYGCDPMGIRRRVIIDGMMGSRLFG